MVVRNSFKFVLAMLFGIMLLVSFVYAILPVRTTAADETDQTIQYHYAQVVEVSDDNLVAAGDYRFYADGFREGQWIHYQTLDGKVIRVADTYEDLINPLS